jgi:hypothetical protein
MTASWLGSAKWKVDDMWIGIAALLAVCWVIAFFVMHISSFLIHIILLVAVIALVYHFIRGRSGA